MAEPSDRENSPLIRDSSTDDFPVECQRKALDKLTRTVVLLCMGIAFVAYIDRTNIGYAANDLCSDLHLSHSEYGTAVSLFYIGYVVSQPPSNVMLRRFGAPVWLAFIICVWGFVAICTAFIRSLWQFYVVRTLLGLVEGGAFPGIFYYLNLFFPDVYIEEAYASVIASVSLSMPISSPIAAGLLSSDGIYGTRGWRNLLFVEGLIPIAFAVILLFFLPKSLETVPFLNPDEREWLIKQQNGRKDSQVSNFLKESWEISKSFRFWLLTYSWGMTSGVASMLYYWIALIIQDGLNENKDDDKETCGSGGSSVVAVALTAIPYTICGLVCLSMRTKTRSIPNRTVFSGSVYMLTSILLLSWIWTREVSFVFGFISLTAAISIWGTAAIFLIGTISTMFRPELRSTTVGLANGLGNLGSFVLPIIVGHIVDAYGYRYAISFSAFILMTAAISVLVVKDPLLTTESKDSTV